jgi:hypothetical protein
MTSLMGRAGATVGRFYPHVDRDVWLLKRRLAVREPMSRLDAVARSLPLARPRPDGAVHLVVVVHDGPDAANWHVAGGNHFYEVHQSAVEALGADHVTLFGVERDEPTAAWHERLLRVVAETNATHLIAQVEVDPNQHGTWNWDVVLPVLSRHWHGTTIGLMYDSAYEWLRIRVHRLGRQTGRLLIAELCEPMSGFIRPGQYEVGPMTMPLSQQSISAIDAYVADLPKEFDVSFIGALYDYRIEMLDRLRSSGLNVAVNPHRADDPSTYEASRTNQPTYLDYMAGLARSELTINFSLANGGPHEQYKIRVHEAALVGCLPLTDDGDRTRHFYAPNEYQFFGSVDDLSDVIAARLVDRDRLRADQAAARERAHLLSRTDFWGRIDVGLQRRGLPVLTRVQPPAAP